MNAIRRFIQGARNLSPSCKESVQWQARATQGNLNMTERIGLKLHLFLCAWCRRYKVQMNFLRNALRKTPPPEPAPRVLPREARERIKQKLQCNHNHHENND
jgi:hypothetical protein